MRSTFGKIQKRTDTEIDDAVLTVTEKDAAKIEWPLNRRWGKIYFFAALIFLTVLFGRTFFMNAVEGERYRELALRNSVRLVPLPAPRGIVYDRFGVQLVHNIPSVDAVLVPADAPRDDDGRDHLKRSLADFLSVPGESVDAAFSKSGSQVLDPVLLKARLSQEEVITFLSREKDFPGVSLYKSAYREYAESVIFSHVLGFEGKITEGELVSGGEYLPTDMIGKQGVEKSYEHELRGERGYERIEVDSLGRPKKTLGTVASVPGSDIFLNIDSELQERLFDSLQSLLEGQKLSRGAAIAIDPRDGSVLALVSVPSFDNNLFAEGISTDDYRAFLEDESKPLFNRAIAGAYPPGSTWKPVMASAALSEGIVSEHTEIESRGGISVGSFFFGDWKVHGWTDIRRAIAVSSDVYFYTIGGGYGGTPGLGIRRIKEYAQKFGFGEPTGIDLPGEVSGFLPDPEWKQRRFNERWYIGDDYHVSIGQGFLTATPLQIVNSIAAIANGGTLYEPRVVSSVRTPDGKIVPSAAKVIREGFIDPGILRIVREGMRETVTEGTAMSLRDLPLPVAGKTGTAQYGSGDQTHGWFVSFAPYDDPQIAMIVLVEGQEGETYNAVPVTKEVYEWYLKRLSGVETEED